MKPLTDYQPGDTVRHRIFGRGKLIEIHHTDTGPRWRVDFDRDGVKTLAVTLEQLDSGNAATEEKDRTAMDMETLKEALRDVLWEENVIGETAIAERWYGGKIVLHPGKAELKSKEIPLNDFFHKIVMVRDRLRVLEQRINSHELLDDAEKIALQQYITRIYGSLTTFNVLFADREDWFVGSKGE